ncbi:protein kinase [Streptomyces sp. DG2A-72]|uniref:serine/threonine-protein kinase n=1 Tax=Streptomyces sp. DG2A-72 TaxID=3051386 RepID=UPI00265C33D4|nr:serine/threonine-protein kinase [Streptomyces sp. DG2A-72]MDO0933143.1 protein kinase [Streptomyces sp. DG2A-72]
MVTGRYRLVESIGQGGMGRVWRAADEMLDRQVAVKEMRIDGLDAEDARTRRERTLREARATARIDHPNVVRVYDVVDEGERLWIVMELIAGRSLERIMAEDGPLGQREAARIGLGLVEALRQVHARGVLHRDIKPGNVLVESGGQRVVLTDFGIAAIQDAKALTMAGMLVGSPDYMAPERVSGRPQGPPSDIWSLGATLCAAMGGRSPFSRDTTLATLHAVLYEEPEIPSSAGMLATILAALLEKEPSVRPGLDDLESTLRSVAAESDTGAAPQAVEGEEEQKQEAAHTRAEPEPQDAAPQPPESPTPALIEPHRIPAPRDPRQSRPEPVEDAKPPQPHPQPQRRADTHDFGRSRTSVPASDPAPTPASASTEAASELRSETRSETPSANSAARGRTGVSFVRAEAATHEHSPPYAAQPVAMPPGELPGPAVPAGPGRGRRRTGPLAAVAAVTAGAVIAVVLVLNSGSPDDKKAGASTPPRDTPSSTVEGTSRPQTLPPGARKEAGGYAWVPPDGWRRDTKTGSEVHYTSPDAEQELATKSSLARGDLLENWETSEQNARRGQAYQKIRLQKTTFRGYPAVVWEYTFTLKGVPWHAQLLGFTVEGKTYQVNTWYQPDIEAQALKTYKKVKNTFTVL